MTTSTFENPLFAVFADKATAAEFTPERTVARYGEVEAALTGALAATGLVGARSGETILAAIAAFKPDWQAFAEAGVADGLPGPSYVRQLKASVPAEDRDAVHLGATSQDVMDTALALTLRVVNGRFADRLDGLVDALDRLAATWGDAALMARTRMQAALPVTAGSRIAAWRGPLARQRARFENVRADVECVELAGPVGTGGTWGDRAPELRRRVAEALDLGDPGESRQTGRDVLVTYGGWLATTCGALGKIGIDVALMAQQGIDEIVLSGGGTSSAMAHKHNPVGAEVLVALARYAAAQESALQQAMVHEQERSGAAWSLEWLALPQLVMTTGAALTTAARLLAGIDRIGEPAGGPR